MKTSLEEYQAFIQVVNSGSISMAANHLGQTPSGVSRSLSRLEQKLGVTLLNRTTRRLELTEEGRALLPQAQDILDSVEKAEEQMALRQQQPSGRLRINAATPFMLHVVVPLIGEFRRRYPHIDLELYSSEQFIDLIEQHTDLALRIGSLRDSSLHARALGRSRLRVLASPEYLRKRGRPETVADLERHCLLGFSELENLNHWPLRHALANTVSITPNIRAASGETLRHLALAGNGLVCLSDFMTLEDRRDGRLVEVLSECTEALYLPIHAVYYRNSSLAARIGCFLDYLSEQLQKPEWAML